MLKKQPIRIAFGVQRRNRLGTVLPHAKLHVRLPRLNKDHVVGKSIAILVVQKRAARKPRTEQNVPIFPIIPHMGEKRRDFRNRVRLGKMAHPVHERLDVQQCEENDTDPLHRFVSLGNEQTDSFSNEDNQTRSKNKMYRSLKGYFSSDEAINASAIGINSISRNGLLRFQTAMHPANTANMPRPRYVIPTGKYIIFSKASRYHLTSAKDVGGMGAVPAD